MKTRGRCGALATASARCPVPCTAAVDDPPLLGVRPASDDAFSRQVNHSVETGNQLWRTGAVPGPIEFDPHRLPIREPGM